MKNRTAVLKLVKQFCKDLTKDDANGDYYEKFINGLSDAQLGEWINDMVAETEGAKFRIQAPNFSSVKITTENNLKVAKKYKINMYSRLTKTLPDGTKERSPIPRMVINVPCRRVSQIIQGQMKTPRTNKVIDSTSGQPTGESKGGTISLPEAIIGTTTLGFTAGLEEVEKVRGGDSGAYQAMLRSIATSGEVDLASVKHHATGVKSVQYMEDMMVGMCVSLK